MISYNEAPTQSGRRLIQFKNCLILRDRKLTKEDFWIENGKIKNPEKLFYVEKRSPDIQVDCRGLIVAPGLIDVQINGGFGVDFSSPDGIDEIESKVRLVGKHILSNGVTSFCPTIVSSPPEIYRKALKALKRYEGGSHGAGLAGIHLEGPFISMEKRGAHSKTHVCTPSSSKDIAAMYGDDLSQVSILTLAPELPNACQVISTLVDRGIRVSLGHSTASLTDSENAVRAGATCITHLFNAMVPFGHRDPGLVGLLTSTAVSPDRPLFYSLIADGIHTEDPALRIAHRTLPEGLILITDANAGLGMGDGIHVLGDQKVEVSGYRAVIQGTNNLAGSVSTLDHCVRHFLRAARCSLIEAIECGCRHPAEFLGISNRKGTLAFGSDADFILLDPESLHVQSTFINGDRVFSK